MIQLIIQLFAILIFVTKLIHSRLANITTDAMWTIQINTEDNCISTVDFCIHFCLKKHLPTVIKLSEEEQSSTSKLWGICHVGSHSISAIWHKWTHTTLTPARQDDTQLAYPGGMKGWVDICGGWIPKWFKCIQAVAHPSSNRTCCRATSLIETNVLTPTTIVMNFSV